MTPGRLLVVAPLGPVVTGRSAVSRFMAQAFRDAGIPVVEANVGPRSRSAWGRALRPAAFGAAIVRILADRGRTIRAVYVAVDAGSGMALTLATVVAARLTRANVVLHHHSYGYLRRRRARAARLLRAAGREAVNVVQCPSMLARLGEHYGAGGVVVSNAAIVPGGPPRNPTSPTTTAGAAVSIGFLGDVTPEKGFTEAVRTAVALATSLPGSRLVVAGPCKGSPSRTLLDQALRRHPGVVEYRGPLDARGKEEFFASIDVFVFPSRYDHETQGVVNLEALAHGVPVVARATGCVPEDLRAAPGMVVAEDHDFAAVAAGAIAAWARRGELAALQDGARSHFDALRSEAGEQCRHAVELVAGLAATAASAGGVEPHAPDASR